MGKRTKAFVTSMDQPLGCAVGNALEIRESLDVLEGKGPPDVTELVVILGGAMLEIAGIEEDRERARELIREALTSGRAREQFSKWVKAQKGDASALEQRDLPRAAVIRDALAPRSGKIARIDAREIGYAANALGAGRKKLGDRIDPAVGFMIHARLGDDIREGDSLAEIHARSEEDAEEAARRISRAISIEDEAIAAPALILAYMD
jgi:pyrimidine-nucleoside phosphorylase